MPDYDAWAYRESVGDDPRSDAEYNWREERYWEDHPPEQYPPEQYPEQECEPCNDYCEECKRTLADHPDIGLQQVDYDGTALCSECRNELRSSDEPKRE